MTRPSLKSRFGEQIRAFVGYKNSLGFPYDESIRILGRFDDFCVERFPEKDCLDCELALAWLEKRDTENTAGHRNRIMVIREFAKYLRAVGTEAYMIPISMTSKGPGYVPHIFNEAEIKAFFHGADSFRPHEKAPARHLVIPVFYRLLYCCGLRPAEARLLKKENVDLVRGSVYVVESKGHKDRVVAVADDLLQIMRSYSTLISEIYPDSDYFFRDTMGMGRIRSVGQKKCFGDASVWPELLRLRDLNLGFTISDILLQRNVSVVGCEKAVILMQCCRFSPHTWDTPVMKIRFTMSTWFLIFMSVLEQ